MNNKNNTRINKIISVSLVIISIFYLCISCTQNDTAADNYSKTGDVKLAAINIPLADDIADIAFYGDTAYATYTDGIIAYNLAAGESEIFAEGYPNLTAICANADSVFAYDSGDKTVIAFNSTGEFTDYAKKYTLINPDTNVRYMRVYLDTIILCADTFTADEYINSVFYKLNTSTGESAVIAENFKGSNSYCFVADFDFQDANTLLITGTTSMDVFGLSYKLFKYDLLKGETVEEFAMPYFNSIYYDNKAKILYYSANNYLNKFDFDATSGVKISTLSDSRDENISFNRLIYSDGTAIVWDKLNAAIYVKDSLNNENSIKIIMPKSTRYTFDIEPVVEQFKSLYDCDVFISEYDPADYTDKLRTKLLANDSDFDVFFLQDPNNGMLLNSILENSAFEPLNEYSGVVDNFENMFSGLKSIMTYNGNIFAVPLDVSPYITYGANENFQKYGIDSPNLNPVYSDLWKLCDDLIASGNKNVGVLPDNYYNTLFYSYTQNAIDTNNLDKDALRELLQNVKKHSDAGVLYGDADMGKDALLSFGYSTNYFYYFMRPEGRFHQYPQNGVISMFSPDGKDYCLINDCAAVNKFSQNKDFAAKFLEVLTSKENLLSRWIFTGTILTPDFANHDLYNTWSEEDLLFLQNADELLKDAKIITFDTSLLNNFVLENIKDKLLTGEISVDKATDDLYNFIYYMCFE
ncbi:hypothetical protein FACS1894105_12270 [Clostridia bacterium]|nr:hypothetical protein FACS1894105_12270 [Clostridia bacterium]